jgi:hypothetical protein
MVSHYAVRNSESAPTYRVVKMAEFQAFLFGKRKPYVFPSRSQAEAVAARLNDGVAVPSADQRETSREEARRGVELIRDRCPGIAGPRGMA